MYQVELYLQLLKGMFTNFKHIKFLLRLNNRNLFYERPISKKKL